MRENRIAPRRAFTLVELLLVAFVILVLAAMTTGGRMGGIREAQIRSRVARVKADMRYLASAIEAYRNDHGVPPPAVRAPGRPMAGAGNERAWLDAVGPAFGVPLALTTPVAYIHALPADPFSPFSGGPSLYFRAGDDWLLASFGPDKRADIADPAIYFAPSDRPPGRPHASIADVAYDPTNGSTSAGDVWRAGEERAPTPAAGTPSP